MLPPDFFHNLSAPWDYEPSTALDMHVPDPRPIRSHDADSDKRRDQRRLSVIWDLPEYTDEKAALLAKYATPEPVITPTPTPEGF